MGSVLVKRLADWYWLTWLADAAAVTDPDLLPIDYVHERERALVPDYDARRIRALVDELEAGTADWPPIEIDCQWFNNRPTRPVLIDGHHRLAAALITRTQRIKAECSGPVEMIDWLEGRTRKLPEWA